MSLHVIVEKRNTKMLHTGFPQQAWALTAEKANLSLFHHRGKDQPPFLSPRTSCWMWAWKEPGRSLVAASADGVEGAGTPSTDCPDTPEL